MAKYRDVENWDAYRVTSEGEIQSRWVRGARPVRMGDEWVTLVGNPDRDGYFLVMLCDGKGTRKIFKLHQLIAAAFHGPPPSGLEVRHLDGDKTNNRPGNLAYATHKENCSDHAKFGINVGSRQGLSKLTEDLVLEIRDARGKVSARELGLRYGVRMETIHVVWRRQTWKHI